MQISGMIIVKLWVLLKWMLKQVLNYVSEGLDDDNLLHANTGISPAVWDGLPATCKWWWVSPMHWPVFPLHKSGCRCVFWKYEFYTNLIKK